MERARRTRRKNTEIQGEWERKNLDDMILEADTFCLSPTTILNIENTD